ncbi:hypothetical protein ACE6ED_27770 [Paenibacillus sp. CN-4]|uniref:hypothetical protein n=1 Tax=Paenibacillus nanchangensis TaxID=3348343 RepID=UPI00397E1B55
MARTQCNGTSAVQWNGALQWHGRSATERALCSGTVLVQWNDAVQWNGALQWHGSSAVERALCSGNDAGAVERAHSSGTAPALRHFSGAPEFEPEM